MKNKYFPDEMIDTDDLYYIYNLPKIEVWIFVVFLDKNNYTDLEVLMHICYVMVIELHKKGGQRCV